MIQIKDGIEVSGPGRYHVTVVVDGKEWSFYVPHREFGNAELDANAGFVMEQLCEAKSLYFYEYDAAGNKIYTGLCHHDPEVWNQILEPKRE